MRTPMSSKIALAIAGATRSMLFSRIALAPKGAGQVGC